MVKVSMPKVAEATKAVVAPVKKATKKVADQAVNAMQPALPKAAGKNLNKIA